MSDLSRAAVATVVAGAAATCFLSPAAARSAPALRPSHASAPTSTGSGLGAAGLGVMALGTAAAVRGRTARRQAPPAVVEKVRPVGDLSGALPDCPATIWNAEDIDIKKLPKVSKTAPLIIDANELGEELQKGSEKEWIAAQKEKIMAQLQVGDTSK